MGRDEERRPLGRALGIPWGGRVRAHFKTGPLTTPNVVRIIGRIPPRGDERARVFERRGSGHRAAVDLEGIQTGHGDDFGVSCFVVRSRYSRCGARKLGPGIGDTTSPSPPAAL